MSYIDFINYFWELDETWQFTCCETRLYFYLLKTANRLGWVNSWTHSDVKTAANVGVSVNSFKSSRNRLVQAGIISFQNGGKGQGDKCRYQILIPKQQPKPIPKLTPKPIPKQQPKANYTLLDEIDKDKDNIPPLPPKGDLGVKIDFDFYVLEFNRICISLPKVEKLTDKRKKKLAAREKDFGREKILDVFLMAEQSDFLSGRSGNWSASLDWLLEPANFVKVLEGNYKNKNNNANKTSNGNSGIGENFVRNIAEGYARAAGAVEG